MADGPYFLGSDTSEGLLSGDWQTLEILNFDGDTVLQGRYKLPVIVFSGLMAVFCSWFGCRAYIEKQNTGPEVYRYLREEVSEAEIRKYNAHPILSLSLPATLVANNTGTRPQLIALLLQAVEHRVTLIKDRETLREALSLERKENGKIEAAAGCHDDIMIGRAIALKGRRMSLMESDNYVDIPERVQTTEERYGYIPHLGRSTKQHGARDHSRAGQGEGGLWSII